MFEWQTDDETNWEAPSETVAETAATQRRSRRKLGWLLLIVAVVGLGAWGWQQLRTRAAEVDATTTADVLTSHRLVAQSATAADTELFVSLLSGSNGRWALAQQRLLQQENLWGRTVLGLQWRPDAAPKPVVTVTPDLQSAEVEAEQVYQLEDADGTLQTVRLQQTAVYRRGANRWLLAPPTAAFWGSTERQVTRYLDVAYPTRDAVVIVQLLEDLDATVAKVCGLEDMACAADWRLPLRFSADPTSLLEMTLPAILADPRPALTLPTPSLVGVPVDPAGYYALQRAYAAPLATAVLADQIGWTCCEQGLFYQALLAWQLAELGLRPWPVTAVQYDNVLDSGFTLAGLRPYWSRKTLADDFYGAWPVYALVAYLVEIGEQSPVTLLRGLAAGDYERWLWQASGAEHDSFAALEQEWWLYAHLRSSTAEMPALRLRP